MGKQNLASGLVTVWRYKLSACYLFSFWLGLSHEIFRPFLNLVTIIKDELSHNPLPVKWKRVSVGILGRLMGGKIDSWNLIGTKYGMEQEPSRKSCPQCPMKC
jgi:hypothetical protein